MNFQFDSERNDDKEEGDDEKDDFKFEGFSYQQKDESLKNDENLEVNEDNNETEEL